MIIDGRLLLYPLLRVALALMAGIIVGDALCGSVGTVVWLWLFAAAVVGVGALVALRANAMVRTVAVYMAVALLGAWRVAAYSESLATDFVAHGESYEAVVVSRPVMKPRTMRYELVVTHGRLAGQRVFGYFKTGNLNVGDGIIASSRFSPNTNDTRWLRSHGIVGSTFVADGHWRRAVVDIGCLSSTQRLQLRLYAWRDRLLGHYGSKRLSDAAGPLVAAMTLGDKTRLTDELRHAYSVSGASHVLALSGLHLGIIYMLLTMLFVRHRSWALGYVIVLSVMWGYVLMVGMPPSVVRSAVMFTVFAVTSILSHSRVSLNTLSLTAVIMLGVNPMNLWNISFQMSFLAVFGIIVFQGRLSNAVSARWLQRHRLAGWCWSLVTVSLSAQIMVAPLTAFYFGRFSCYFLISNFIAIPLATLVVWMSLLMYLLFLLPWLQGLVADALNFVASAMNGGLVWVASLPGASVENMHVGLLQLVLMYVAIALVYVLSRYVVKMYHSAYGFNLEEHAAHKS